MDFDEETSSIFILHYPNCTKCNPSVFRSSDGTIAYLAVHNDSLIESADLVHFIDETSWATQRFIVLCSGDGQTIAYELGEYSHKTV